MKKYEICVNGTAYEVNVDEAECMVTNELPMKADINNTRAMKKLNHLRNRYKSYVKWLRHIKARN